MSTSSKRFAALLVGALLVGLGKAAHAIDDNVLRASLEGEADEKISGFLTEEEAYEEQAIIDYVQSVVDSLGGQGRYSAFLVHTDEVYASGLANKTIVVTTSLMARLANEAQLAMVIAHELVHVKREHLLVIKRAEIAEENRRSSGGFGDLLGRAGDIAVASGAISSITGTSSGAVSAGVSTANTVNVAIESVQASMASAGPDGLGEELEDDADKYSVRYLKDANYDTQMAASAWELLGKYSGSLDDRYFYGNPEALAERSKNTIKLAKKYDNDDGRGSSSDAYCKNIFEVSTLVAREDLDANRFKSAKSAIDCALLAKPEDPRTRYLNGVVLRETARSRSDYREAIDEFSFVLELIPKQGSTHREIGYTYREVDDFELALYHLNKYLELRPNAKDANEVATAVEQINATLNSTEADEDW